MYTICISIGRFVRLRQYNVLQLKVLLPFIFTCVFAVDFNNFGSIIDQLNAEGVFELKLTTMIYVYTNW